MRRVLGHVLPIALLLIGGSSAVQAATLTVTNTADSGAGSLREAISAANASAGPDTIEFSIPGGGPHVISPITALPSILDALTIDGYTQTGSSENTLAIGNDAVLQIVLDGSAMASGLGLDLRAPDCRTRSGDPLLPGGRDPGARVGEQHRHRGELHRDGRDGNGRAREW